MIILVDTGPLVSLFDKSDNYHNTSLDLLKSFKFSLITTAPVLTEAFYLLSFSWEVQNALWEFLDQGYLGIYDLDRALYKRCRYLMNKYQDLPMDFADSSLVSIAIKEDISTVFTLDHKDFRIYRRKNNKPFKLLPSEL